MLRCTTFVIALAALLFTTACSHPNIGIRMGSDSVPPDDSQEDQEAPRILVVVEDRFVLYYPETFAQFLPLEDLLMNVFLAFQRVEAYLGEMQRPVTIAVVGRIVPADENFPDNLTIAGLCAEIDGEIRIWVAFPAAFSPETFAHELLHARFRDLGLEPARWLEEGVAHFFDYADGFNPYLLAILNEQGIMSREELRASEGVDEHEMKRRASAWANVYYLVKVQGLSILDVANGAELPDPEVVLAAVQAESAKRGDTCEASSSSEAQFASEWKLAS